jgi:hypothetical protein
MKRYIKIAFSAATIIGVGWGALTLVAEIRGPKKSWDLGDSSAKESVLIVYDPDPFYDLDQQVCLAFADVLTNEGMKVKVASVSAAEESNFSNFNGYVFCANTYNWAPDWALTKYIENQESLNKKPVIAITLGSGSTKRSQTKLEQLVIRKGGNIIDSHSLWLMRPNDEARMEEPNIQVAISIVRNWAAFVAPKMHEPK